MIGDRPIVNMGSRGGISTIVLSWEAISEQFRLIWKHNLISFDLHNLIRNMDWIRSLAFRSLASRSLALSLVLTLCVLGAGCRQSNRGAEKLAEDSSAAQNLNSNLTFNNITLEQANDQGEVMWKVKAVQAIYSPDQKIAKVTSPDGELYQDNKPVYHIQAERGEVRRAGDRIILQGNVVATDLQSGAILKGNQLEWQPQKDLLIVRGNLTGTHPQLQFSANEARASNRKREIQVLGNINAITQEEPKLKLLAEQLLWQIDKQMVLSDRPIQIQRLQGEQVTDQANGDTAEVNLQTKTAKLMQNAVVTTVDPPLQITGNSLVWNVPQKTLVADQPITAVHQTEQITITANQGRMELDPKTAFFKGNVRATGQKNQSILTSDRLTWNIDNQRVEAEGSVVYVQPNPQATLRGPRAVGKLQDQTIVVSGGRVETQIVPQGVN